MTNQELHLKTKSVAKTYLQIEADLVALLIEMDWRRAFRDLGYASLFQYCMLELKLSEAVTSAFITVSRKAAVMPDLMEALETQTLTVSKAAKITAALNVQQQEETKQIIEFAASHSTAQTEKWLREKRGVETFHNLKLTSAQMEKLKKVRGLAKEALSLEAALELALDEYIQKHGPLEKAQRQRLRNTVSPSTTKNAVPSQKMSSPKQGAREFSVDSESNTSHPVRPTKDRPEPRHPVKISKIASRRRRLPVYLKHFVITRDENRCQYEIRPGLFCRNPSFLDIHHRRARIDGGTDHPANLILLCRAHHQMEHRKH